MRARVKLIIQYAYWAFDPPNRQVKSTHYGIFSEEDRILSAATFITASMLTKHIPVVTASLEPNLTRHQLISYNYERRKLRQFCYDLVDCLVSDRIVDEIMQEVEREGLPTRQRKEVSNTDCPNKPAIKPAIKPQMTLSERIASLRKNK